MKKKSVKSNKKEIIFKYNKKKVLYTFMRFLDSPKSDLLKFEYAGKELNILKGLEKDMLHGGGGEVPFKFYLTYLKIILIQVPLFNLIKGMEIFELKNKIFRMFGAKIGEAVTVSPGVFFDPMFPNLISIGDGTIIGKDVSLITHEFTVHKARFGRIKIGRQVLIGANSIVRSGIKIGDGAVIAMGSVVNRNVPAMEEWGGVPARKIKKLNKLV